MKKLSKNLKIVFFGTPLYVIPIVAKLYSEYSSSFDKSIVAVVTQPPRPVGRKKKMTHSPVDHWAFKKKLPIILEPRKSPEADLGVVASYGEIIPESVIRRFKYGVLNVHPSLLPKWRGASPIQASMIAGDSPTGVSVIKMDAKMDHGPIVSSFTEEIYEDDTAESLRGRLFEKSALFLVELIPNYITGKVNLSEQEHKKATFTRRILRRDGFIEPNIISDLLAQKKPKDMMKIDFMGGFKLLPTVANIERFMRAMKPWPGAWTIIQPKPDMRRGLRLKILEAHLEDNKLILDKVQLEGKKSVSFKQFQDGYPEHKFEK